MALKALVIGLGSMGKRRIRILKSLGIKDISGFDSRRERLDQVRKQSGVTIVNRLNDARKSDLVVVSTPPQEHDPYIQWALENRLPCFVELSVVPGRLPALLRQAGRARVLVAPSSSFLFHPAIAYLQKTIQQRRFGRVTGFSYHTGSYLTDWHPWEKIRDFFVSRKETSGCKEILSIELHWMWRVLGIPQKSRLVNKRAVGFKLPSDDTCAIALEFKDFAGTLMVDVVSRFPTRQLIVNFERGQYRWNAAENSARFFDATAQSWKAVALDKRYGAGVMEKAYFEELKVFVGAVRGKGRYPWTLREDMAVLNFINRMGV